MVRMSQPRSLLILYGSQSGNSEDIAVQAGKASKELGLNPTVSSMDEIKITDLIGQQRVLICCSTWGDGEQPDNAEELWEAANGDSISSLEGLNFSVLALGDSSYDLFCESGKEWDSWFESKGATRVHQRVDCDVDFDEPAQSWTNSVLKIMASIEDNTETETVSVESSEEVEEVVNDVEVDGSPEYTMKNPYLSNISVNYVLNGEGSRKETRHIVFDLGDSGLEYKAGDALGVFPTCPPDLVESILARLGCPPEEIVVVKGEEMTLREALLTKSEIHRLSKRFIEGLAPHFSSSSSGIQMRIVSRSRTNSSGLIVEDWQSSSDDDLPEHYTPLGPIDDPEKSLWTSLVNDAKMMEDYIWSRDYLDFFTDFPNIRLDAQEFVDAVDTLKPRLYSIASSPDFEPGTVHLTVGIVRYSHHERDRTGLTTGFLADRCKANDTLVPVFMSPTRSFILPKDGSHDIIMVGPGTGIAPFRAFLQQREIDGSSGNNWLFFGDWTEEGEYYYRDEIESWLSSGNLERIDLAWSRQGEEKVYVQHLMEKNGQEIWSRIDAGGYFYVCGDKNYMAKDVHKMLIQICSEHGDMTLEEASHYVEQRMMKDEKRYLRDVY
ncbi:MAG: sulfite reductase subunit alpha [Euryarchaeota archaeon]|nr:sulfite reductase subunit alpha [Euryarchaeota archaeon]